MPKPRATLKQSPADFRVAEQIDFPLTGHGEHLWCYVEKTGLNTAFPPNTARNYPTMATAGRFSSASKTSANCASARTATTNLPSPCATLTLTAPTLRPH